MRPQVSSTPQELSRAAVKADLSREAQLEAAFSAAKRGGADAVSVLASPFIVLNMRRVIDLACCSACPPFFGAVPLQEAAG
jgi:hypothetical protein